MQEQEKVALITGGGRGMGAAVARELRARGYRLALMSPTNSCKELANELSGVAHLGCSENHEDIQAIVDLALTQYGRIDSVVNHTGHPPKGDLLSIEDEQWRLGAEMIILSVVRMSRLVTPIMESQGGGGAFLNITTFASFEPSLAFPVSCVFRAGVGAFTKLFADRYAEKGIRMNALLPGFIDSLDHPAERAETVPMKRIGTVEEIGKAAAFLLSEDAGYITGQNIRIDGGMARHI
jgi:NAD(P)-dependent dehydrogenase (short-subunit alcohol dehydrogenase family)